jgi:hypothetical protein
MSNSLLRGVQFRFVSHPLRDTLPDCPVQHGAIAVAAALAGAAAHAGAHTAAP